jgi:hypothetical protein
VFRNQTKSHVAPSKGKPDILCGLAAICAKLGKNSSTFDNHHRGVLRLASAQSGGSNKQPKA